MGVSATTAGALCAAGHDAVHLRDEGLITLPDTEILEKGRRERRIVLTFDLDFGDLLAARR
jgi:predicted nuclease of predicted toxin-antitoxin system